MSTPNQCPGAPKIYYIGKSIRILFKVLRSREKEEEKRKTEEKRRREAESKAKWEKEKLAKKQMTEINNVGVRISWTFTFDCHLSISFILLRFLRGT